MGRDVSGSLPKRTQPFATFEEARTELVRKLVTLGESYRGFNDQLAYKIGTLAKELMGAPEQNYDVIMKDGHFFIMWDAEAEVTV